MNYEIWDELKRKGVYRPVQELSSRPRRRRRRKKPEAKVQTEIVRYLVSKGVVLAVTDAGLLAKMGLGMGCGVPAGWPDLTGCTPGGRFIGVEVKSAKGRQSEAQAEIQKRIEKAGGLYILAHSLAELKSELAKEEKLDNIVGFLLDD